MPNPGSMTVARVARAHGRHGEVAAEILTDFPERLLTLGSADLRDGKNAARRVLIRACRLSLNRGGQAIFHFEGCDSILEAERLVGFEIQIPIEQRLALRAGSYYVSDLIGCDVFDCIGAFERLGVVSDVQFLGENVAGTPLLVVASPRGELLIPLATEICTRIDTEARRIEVVLPDGLRELNRG